jgi:hypothetical protein
MTDEQVLTAYHEAAHAVAALALRQRCEDITLDPPVCDVVSTNHRVRVVIFFAGRYGEGLLGYPGEAAPYVDEVKARRIFKEHLAGGEDTLADLDAEARWLVRRYRGAVRRLAQALLDRGRLAEAEVAEAVGPLVPPTPFGPAFLRR